jgi:hypothetical protein
MRRRRLADATLDWESLSTYLALAAAGELLVPSPAGVDGPDSRPVPESYRRKAGLPAAAHQAWLLLIPGLVLAVLLGLCAVVCSTTGHTHPPSTGSTAATSP